MNRVMRSTLCRLLIALIVWTPSNVAQAGMIGTQQVVSSAQTDRSAVLTFLNRADVANQLRALGVDSAAIKNRVTAMTDEEVSALGQRLDSLPAGGMTQSVKVLLVLIIIGAVIWWTVERSMQA